MSDRKSPCKTVDLEGKTSFLEFAREFLAPSALNQLIEGEVKDELEAEDLKAGVQVRRNEMNESKESKLSTKSQQDLAKSTAADYYLVNAENEKPALEEEQNRSNTTTLTPIFKRRSHRPAFDLGTPVVRSEIHRPPKTVKRRNQNLPGEEATSNAPLTQHFHAEENGDEPLIHPLNQTVPGQEFIHGSSVENVKPRSYQLPHRTKEQLHVLFGAKAATNTQTREHDVDQVDTQPGKEKDNQSNQRAPSRLNKMFSKSKKEPESEHEQSSCTERTKEKNEKVPRIEYTKDMGVYDQTKDFESRLRKESQRNGAAVTYSIDGHTAPTRVRFFLVKEAPRSRIGCNNKVAPVDIEPICVPQFDVARSTVKNHGKSCSLPTQPKNSKFLIPLPTPPKSCKAPKWFKRRKADSPWPKPVAMSEVDEEPAESVSSQFNVHAQSSESLPSQQEPIEQQSSRPSRAGRRQKT